MLEYIKDVTASLGGLGNHPQGNTDRHKTPNHALRISLCLCHHTAVTTVLGMFSCCNYLWCQKQILPGSSFLHCYPQMKKAESIMSVHIPAETEKSKHMVSFSYATGKKNWAFRKDSWGLGCSMIQRGHNSLEVKGMWKGISWRVKGIKESIQIKTQAARSDKWASRGVSRAQGYRRAGGEVRNQKRKLDSD